MSAFPNEENNKPKQFRRAGALLDSLESKGVTKEGVDYIKAAIDPFHDVPLNPTGAPTGEDNMSVVRNVRVSIDIVAPASAGGGKWDAHIATTPMSITTNDTGSTGFEACLSRGTVVVSSLGASATPILGPAAYANATMGMLTVATAPENYSTFPDVATFADCQNVVYTGLSPVKFVVDDEGDVRRPVADRDWLNSRHRIATGGFEVVYAGPMLTASGSVTTYRTDQNVVEALGLDCRYEGDAAPPTIQATYGAVTMFRAPPANRGAAVAIPGSQTWAAPKGSYSVFCENSDLEWTRPQPRKFVCTGGLSTAGKGYTGAFTDYQSGYPGLAPMQAANCGFASAEVHPCQPLNAFSMSGAYYSGLPPDAVLRLTLHVMVETLPAGIEDPLSTLARPCAPMDTLAIAIARNTTRDLPPAVPVGENPLGEAFVNAVSDIFHSLAPIARVALPMMASVPGPIGAVGRGGIMAANMLQSVLPAARTAPKVLKQKSAAGELSKSQKKKLRRAGGK